MNQNLSPDDARLGALLREARRSPALPPRFQQQVWRRIEAAEATGPTVSWLDALAALIVRPRIALTMAAVLLFSGILLGTHEGAQAAHQQAQARYLASVTPGSGN